MSLAEPIVYIVDDDLAVRESVSILVRSMKISVESFASAADFLSHHTPLQHSCLVLDLKMPEIDGLQLLELLRIKKIEIPVIVVSGHGDIRQAVQALKLGAIDFLEKPYPSVKLRNCISSALKSDALRRNDQAKEHELTSKFDQLTTQEKDVLVGLVAGVATKNIAKNLDVSLRTVQTRRQTIMEKLEVDSRAELIRFAAGRENEFKQDDSP